MSKKYKCKKCKEEYEEYEVAKQGKSYVCKYCDTEYYNWCLLYEEVKAINSQDQLNIKQITQLKRLNKEEGLDFLKMYYTLLYMELIGKFTTEEYDLIGLIKYYYNEAVDYYKSKWELEDNNIIKEREVEIVKTKMVKEEKEKIEKGFDFLED